MTVDQLSSHDTVKAMLLRNGIRRPVTECKLRNKSCTEIQNAQFGYDDIVYFDDGRRGIKFARHTSSIGDYRAIITNCFPLIQEHSLLWELNRRVQSRNLWWVGSVVVTLIQRRPKNYETFMR